MPKVEYDPDMDYEIQQIAKHDNSTKCVCCGDILSDDNINFVIDDVWCIDCIYDADLRGYLYG